MALSRLLPNLGEPDRRVRHLYAGTVHAMALYGAPVWVNRMEATRKIRDLMNQVQRKVANRIFRGYRTVSWAAVGILAGIPPMEMFA
ncbi:reverse transcriptase [Lasius niger]|uniref:Reverse transcriptase n=1 Tax=Lasius niger TaxID=67767 RepID=A0A0J7KF86_LASNI|nr:reverse transcriptase [Lasius niger]